MCGVFPNAAQCTATSKRTRKRCRGPAVRGSKVCRFHGARGGHSSGPAHPSWVHGFYSMEATDGRRRLEVLVLEISTASEDDPV